MDLITDLPTFMFSDEVSAVVLDCGSWTTRAGFAGEDSPKAVFTTYYGVQEIDDSSVNNGSGSDTSKATGTSSTVGSNDTTSKDTDGDVQMSDEKQDARDDPRIKSEEKKEEVDQKAAGLLKSQPSKKTKYFIGDNSVHVPRADTEIKHPLKEGVVEDWDVMEKIWDHALNNVLGVDIREHPFLITEQTWNPRANREKAMELAFESLQTPAFYIAKSPVASLFASGKGSGLVVDIGHEIVSVTPVIDGLSLYKPARRSLYGGKFLANEVRHMLETRYTSTFPHAKAAINTPRYTIATRQIPLKLGAEAQVVLKKFPNSIVNGVPTQSFKEFEILTRTLDEFKQSMCQVSDTPYSAEMEQSVNKRVFEFPDGSNYSFGQDRLIVSECLFQPTLDEFKFDGFPVPSTATPTNKSADSSDDKKDKEAHESAESVQSLNAEKKDSTDKKEGAANGSGTATTATNNGAPAANAASNNSSSTTTLASQQPQPTPSYMLNDVRPIAPFSRTLGLSDLIVSSINACDVDVRHNLANNIVITGGSSLVQGLTDRINQDLSHSLPGLKIRIYAPGNMTERNYSPWVGGSILASLGTFHQLWVSKREYDEVGAEKLLDRRFR